MLTLDASLQRSGAPPLGAAYCLRTSPAVGPEACVSQLETRKVIRQILLDHRHVVHDRLVRRLDV
jgi:hypothetical protein